MTLRYLHNIYFAKNGVIRGCILKDTNEDGAFELGAKGADIIPEILEFGCSIFQSPAKQGMNTYVHINLKKILTLELEIM